MNRTLSLLMLPCLAASLAAQAQPKANAKTKPAAKAPAVKPEAPKSEAKGLAVGDTAPAFKVGRWVKGGPIAELKKGEVTVVEFWATWCGPCRQTIPHLTELSKKYAGKATFIGVDVWERGADEAATDKKVDAFVQEMGDKMGYHVCRDGADKHMTQAWMQAAGQRGIPAAFILDREGRIAFIGNPHPGTPDFEKALDQIVAGTWDLKAAKAKAEQDAAEEKAAEAKEAAAEAAWKKVAPGIEEALKAKDHAKVLALADAAEKGCADLKDRLKQPRFLALAATDATKAQAMVEAETAKPSVDAYMDTALMLQAKGLEKRWAEQSLALIDKAVALEPRLEPQVAPFRFKALLRADAAKAKAQFEVEKAKGAAKAASLARTIAGEDGLEASWTESAAAVLEEALKAPDANGRLHQSLAEARFKLGKAKEAAQSMESFIAWAKKAGAPAQMVAEWEATLKQYQAAAK